MKIFKTALLAALLISCAPIFADAQVQTQNALVSGGVAGNCATFSSPVTITSAGAPCGSGGGGGGITSVFGRTTAAITAQAGDYNVGQISAPGSWTNGQIPIGSTTDGFLHAGTITQGTNITITTSPGGITINSTATGTGCIPGGLAGQLVTSDGAGGCTANSGLTYATGALTAGIAGTLQGSLKIGGVTNGTAIITTPASNGSPTLTLGSNSGTPAVTASSPLAITTATGNVTCVTCTTNAAAATTNQLMVGGGGQAITALGSLGSATTLLHGGAGAPSFSAVSLTADVTGLLPGTNMALATNSTVGAVQGAAAVAHSWVDSWASGIPHLSQPAFGDILGQFSSGQCIAATTSALGCVKPDGSSITVTAGVIAAPGSGGGTVGTGTQSQVPIYFGAGTTTSIKGYTFGNTFTVDNTNLAVYMINPDNPFAADHTLAATDMGAVLPLTGTHTLTFPAISAGPPPIFATGQSSCYTNVGVGNWTISTSPTINGLKSTTIYPSGNGCLVSNGTSLDWQGVAGDEARLNAVQTWNSTQNFAAITGTSSATFGTNGGTIGTLGLNGSSTGKLIITPQTAAGTPTWTAGTSSGTPAVTASAPLAITTATGNIPCATCATTTNGGALTATSPVTISAGGVIALTDNNVAFLDTNQAFTASQRVSTETITISTATFTPNFNTGQDHLITLVHASCPCTLANPSTTPVAHQSGMFVLTQSATGSDTIGTWGSQYLYVGGTSTITLSTGANAVDYLPYYVADATHIVLGALIKGPAH